MELGKRKRDSLEKDIEDMERLYDNCQEIIQALRQQVDETQKTWNDVFAQLDRLYKRRRARRKAKRVRRSITGKICPVVTRKVSFPTLPESM